MHLVHAAADGSLLVIGVLIKRGRANRTLEPIFDDLPENAGDTRDVAGVRIDKLPDTKDTLSPEETKARRDRIVEDISALQQREGGIPGLPQPSPPSA